MYRYFNQHSILKMQLTHRVMISAENSDIPGKDSLSRTHSYLIYLLNLTTNKTNLVIVISPIILEEHDIPAIRTSSCSKIQFTCALLCLPDNTPTLIVLFHFIGFTYKPICIHHWQLIVIHIIL